MGISAHDYELQELETDLYVERQCYEPEYFKKVNTKIDKLDDLNNPNYIAKH